MRLKDIYFWLPLLLRLPKICIQFLSLKKTNLLHKRPKSKHCPNPKLVKKSNKKPCVESAMTILRIKVQQNVDMSFAGLASYRPCKYLMNAQCAVLFVKHAK